MLARIVTATLFFVVVAGAAPASGVAQVRGATVTPTNAARTALQVRRITVQNGRSLDFTYSADGLLEYVAPTTGTPFPPLTIARSILDGHIESTTIGAVTTTESVDVDPTTPGFGDYLGHTVAVGGTTFYESTYTHDRLGRIVGWNETIDGTTRNRTFEFDDAGRLTNVRDGVGTLLSEYAYDANGNRTLADVGGVRRELGVDIGCGAGLTDAANDQDQLCRYGNYLYTYEANGRLAQKAHVTDGSDVTEYAYAGDGRLLRVELPFGGSVIDYVHDATGRRIGRIVDGVFDRGWLYKDGISPVAQLDATGAVEATFVYATRPHVPDFMVMTDGTTYRFVTDHLGSVRALVDATSGTVAERIDYDEWGNVTASTGAWSVQPFGFAGGLHDAATGLVRFGVRDYDPVTGRWTAKEPLGFGGGDTNFYSYVGNEPVNYVDPSGLLILPANPDDLPPEWVEDPTHRDPNGRRFRHPSGDVLDFHKGRPGEPKWRGKDHWHHNEGDEHMPAGSEVPDPIPACTNERSWSPPIIYDRRFIPWSDPETWVGVPESGLPLPVGPLGPLPLPPLLPAGTPIFAW